MADLKVVTEVTVSGAMPTRKSTVTTFYRGSLVRTESDGRIQILDTKTGSLTMIDRARKSYRTVPIKQLLGSDAPARSMKVTAKVAPSGQKRTILGRSAKRYTGSATITNARGTMKMTIEQWAAESLQVPAGMVGGLAGLPGGSVGLSGAPAFRSEFAKIKGLPLEGKITMSLAGAGSRITTESKVKQIQNLSLDTALFRVPSGFKKLESKRSPLERRKLDHADH